MYMKVIFAVACTQVSDPFLNNMLSQQTACSELTYGARVNNVFPTISRRYVNFGGDSKKIGALWSVNETSDDNLAVKKDKEEE